jgi:twitching motility two-component system response regulator PilG/twitching motility two-component system response regulator PilH
MTPRKKLLVADDSRAVVDALATTFEAAGWDVVTAADGEEVFRRLAEGRPDALLLDVYMPRLNGADVCRVVKNHPQWKKAFLVLMSSRLTDGELQMYRRLGADQLLKKPFEPSVALELVMRGTGSAPG